MNKDKCRTIVSEILAPIDISVNGSRPWDVHVVNENFYERVLNEGSLGLGESYIDGWWECDKLDEFFSRLAPAKPEERIKTNWRLLPYFIRFPYYQRRKQVEGVSDRRETLRQGQRAFQGDAR